MGFVAKVELGTLDENGELANRRMVEVGAIEANIPKEFRAFLKSLMPEREG